MSFWLGFAFGAVAALLGPGFVFGVLGLWLLLGLALTVWLIYVIYR